MRSKFFYILYDFFCKKIGNFSIKWYFKLKSKKSGQEGFYRTGINDGKYG